MQAKKVANHIVDYVKSYGTAKATEQRQCLSLFLYQ